MVLGFIFFTERNLMIRDKILNYINSENAKALDLEALAEVLGVSDFKAYLRAIKELSDKSLIVKTRKGKYISAEKAGVLIGKFIATNERFGFVDIENSERADVFIGKREANGALNGDRVIVEIIPKRGRALKFTKEEGRITKIIERANKNIVGTINLMPNFALVVPDDRRLFTDIFIPKEGICDIDGLSDGDKVVCEILRYAKGSGDHLGRIIEVLGSSDKAGVDVESILWQYGLARDFKPALIRQAEKLNKEVSEVDFKGRRDLRALPMVTIDGIDSRDLDDAVFCEKNGDIFTLSVHIADVCHYIEEGSALDREAYNRGTSVYFPDRVIPMLPPALSNGICSLNEGVNRLALSCAMEIDMAGKVRSYAIFESVICVKKRLTYDSVNLALDGNAEALLELSEEMPLLYDLMELQKILEKKRLRRGALNFDFPETKVVMAENNKDILAIKKRFSGLGEKMIEEAMIITNETVAKNYFKLEMPFIYRIHQSPSPTKMVSLAAALVSFGYVIDDSEGLTNATAKRILAECKGKPEEVFVNTVLLRSMTHASYSTSPLGHFGLASPYYSHFTSPIRRYPDLAIHRAIKKSMRKKLSGNAKKTMAESLNLAAIQSSAQEKLAEEAERTAVKGKICQYMQDKIGLRFSGTISGVQNYGIYIALENGVEGLVHVDNLPSADYQYLENIMQLRGMNGDKYGIGDEVKVEVLSIDLEESHIDFVLI